MNDRRRPLLTLLAAALAWSAQPAFADLDLVGAWAAAQQHDPAYAAARAEFDAGGARARQGRALSLPTVTLNGSVGYGAARQSTSGAQFSAPGFGTVDGVDFRSDIRDGTATGWNIRAEQPIYNSERSVNARQLEMQAGRAEIELRAARQDLMLRLVRAYFDVLLAENTLEEIRLQKAATARALDVAQASYDEGKLPITDRDESRARYDGTIARESVAEDELELRRAALADLTGVPVQPLRRVPLGAKLRLPPVGPLDDWLEKSSRHNPQIALRSLLRDIALKEVDKWQATAAPTLSLVALAGGDRLSGNGAYGTGAVASSSNAVVSLQLSVPLYTGGMRTARGDEAVALAERARHEADATRKAVLMQARRAWLGAAGGLTRIDSLQTAVDSARSRLDATEIGYEVGARTTLDLLNAQADLFRARRELQQAKIQVLVDRMALALAAGELSDGELGSANANLAQP